MKAATTFYRINAWSDRAWMETRWYPLMLVAMAFLVARIVIK